MNYNGEQHPYGSVQTEVLDKIAVQLAEYTDVLRDIAQKIDWLSVGIADELTYRENSAYWNRSE